MSLHSDLEEVFQNVFNDDQITLTDATSADDIEGWDSGAHINLMVGIEQAFDVRFNGNQLAEFKNVGQLKEFLEKQCCP